MDTATVFVVERAGATSAPDVRYGTQALPAGARVLLFAARRCGGAVEVARSDGLTMREYTSAITALLTADAAEWPELAWLSEVTRRDGGRLGHVPHAKTARPYRPEGQRDRPAARPCDCSVGG